MRQPGPNVGHAAGDDHAGLAHQRQDGLGGPAADDGELCVRHRIAHRGENPFGKPCDRIDVRPVVHGAGEHHAVDISRIGIRVIARRRKIVCIDAVFERADLVARARRALLQQRRFILRHQQGGVEILRHPCLPCCQFAAFARIHPGQRPALRRRVLRPFVGIDIDHVEHATRKARRHELRHRRGECQPARHPTRRRQPGCPALELAAAVIGQRQRLAAQQAGQAGQPGTARMQRQQLDRRAIRLQCIPVLPVVRIVDEGTEVDFITRAQMPQQMKRADLVALVGRERDAMRKKQQPVHGISPGS